MVSVLVASTSSKIQTSCITMNMCHHGKIKDRVKFRDRNQINSFLFLMRPPVLCLKISITSYKIFSVVCKEKHLQTNKFQLKKWITNFSNSYVTGL